uniref:Uncharacterized protein n=1 Tax=Heterorhabditis bacteriophora TaxID=37862 RepID=A0A1I7WIV4_HETBA
MKATYSREQTKDRLKWFPGRKMSSSLINNKEVKTKQNNKGKFVSGWWKPITKAITSLFISLSLGLSLPRRILNDINYVCVMYQSINERITHK